MRGMRSALFADANRETTSGERFALQSKRMLKVTVGADVLATKGAMVAYQGQLTFSHESAGSMGKFLKRAITGESAPLMRVAGHGEVFFASSAAEVFLIALEGDAISVNGRNLLAFDATLQWDIRRTQGAGIAAGLFNTLISGHGVVALTSDGDPMILDCAAQPTFVDTQAAVCWSANLVPQLVSSLNMRSMLRGGSGEAFQYGFHGPGFVVVQPSEGRVVESSGGGGGGGLGNLIGG